MSWIVSSKELLDAYAQYDSYPNESNQTKLYISMIRNSVELTSIKLAVKKLKILNERDFIPKDLVVDALYCIARGSFLLGDWSSSLYFCEMVLEKKKQYADVKELIDHAKRKLEKEEAKKNSNTENKTSPGGSKSKKSRRWLFGKSTLIQSSSPLLLREIESYTTTIEYLKLNGINRMSDGERKHFSQIFNSLLTKNVESESCIDLNSLTKVFQALSQKKENELPKFLFNGFCRFIDEVIRISEINEEKDDLPISSSPIDNYLREKVFNSSSIQESELSNDLNDKILGTSPRLNTFQTQNTLKNLSNTENSSIFQRENDTDEKVVTITKENIQQPSIVTLIGTKVKGGLTKEYFLYIISILIYGTIEEKLLLSYCCFDPTDQGFIEEEKISTLIKDISSIITSLGIYVLNQSLITRTMWEMFSENTEFQDRITKEEFFINSLKYHSKLMGLGYMFPNPLTPTPKVRGLRTFFGDKEWDFTIDIQLAFRISSQMINPIFLANRELTQEDFQTTMKFTLPRRGQSSSQDVVVFAPHVFSKIRELCGITDSEFYYSLGIERCLGGLLMGELSTLSHQQSDGRSGASFYYTSDGIYVIKMIPSTESKNFFSSLPEYYNHIRDHPDSLLCRYLSSIQIGSTFYIIMKNVFLTNYQIHEIYDLKGSIIARSNKAGPVYKDNDLQYAFEVGPEKAQKLRSILKLDVLHLQQQKFTDYSLLVGVHNVDEGKTLEKSKNQSNYVDDLGFLSKDGKKKFYFGIIDTFTTFNLSKRMEKGLKTIGNAGRSGDISSQSANDFAKRFCDRVIEQLIV